MSFIDSVKERGWRQATYEKADELVTRLTTGMNIRETRSVETRFGKIDVKLAKSGEETKNIAPEYESCRKVAADLGVPLKQIYDEAKSAAEKQLLDD